MIALLRYFITSLLHEVMRFGAIDETMSVRNLNELTTADLVTKRDDPNYAQVSGYIPKELARRFKILCTSEEISQSEALEVAVMMWLREKEASSEKPA